MIQNFVAIFSPQTALHSCLGSARKSEGPPQRHRIGGDRQTVGHRAVASDSFNGGEEGVEWCRRADRDDEQESRDPHCENTTEGLPYLLSTFRLNFLLWIKISPQQIQKNWEYWSLPPMSTIILWFDFYFLLLWCIFQRVVKSLKISHINNQERETRTQEGRVSGAPGDQIHKNQHKLNLKRVPEKKRGQKCFVHASIFRTHNWYNVHKVQYKLTHHGRPKLAFSNFGIKMCLL